MRIEDFMQIINESKEFSFKGSVLTVTGYYTGKSIRLDLSRVTQEMLDELIAEDEDDEDYYYDEEDY